MFFILIYYLQFFCIPRHLRFSVPDDYEKLWSFQCPVIVPGDFQCLVIQIFVTFSILRWHIIVQTNWNNKLVYTESFFDVNLRVNRRRINMSIERGNQLDWLIYFTNAVNVIVFWANQNFPVKRHTEKTKKVRKILLN